MNEGRPQLTISLLISNRMETVSRCLDSLRPIMEAISCELILIDTSKNSQIHDLLLQYTNLVYEFQWCNDFAKARNEGLKRAHGEWFLFLDDDEWFEEVGALIDFFQTGEYRAYGYAFYPVRNFKDKECIYYDDCWLARMFRIEADTRFVRKIHEQFLPIRGARKDLPILVCHSGYIYETEEDRRRHFERNCALLREMVEEEPNNLYWLLQLAQEYSYVGEHEKLVEHCKECLEKILKLDDVYSNLHRGTFYTGLVTGYLRLKQYDRSVEYALAALKDKWTGKVLEAMMHLRLAECYLALQKEKLATEEVQTYLNLLHMVSLDKEKQEDAVLTEELQVFLSGEAFNKNSQEIAYAILICADLKAGKTEALKKYYSKLGWSQPVVYTMENIEKYFVDMMYTMPYETIFAQVMSDVLGKTNLRQAFAREICDRTDVEASSFGELIYRLAYAMQAVVKGPTDGRLTDYVEALRMYVLTVCDWCEFIEAENEVSLVADKTPGYLQAAIYMSEYMELEAQEPILALRKLIDAVKIFPEFADGIGIFLDSYVEFRR